jgi:hypothetical protein
MKFKTACFKTRFLAGSAVRGVGVEVAALSWSWPTFFAKGARAGLRLAFCEGPERHSNATRAVRKKATRAV